RDNDAPRLIYADYLEEHGDADQAEFIRLQVHQASLHRGPWERSMTGREQELLKRHVQEWTSPILKQGVYEHQPHHFDPAKLRFVPRTGRHGLKEVQLERGFLDRISSTTTAFIRYGRGWLTRAPVRAVDLDDLDGRGQQLAGCQHLSAVRELGLD